MKAIKLFPLPPSRSFTDAGVEIDPDSIFIKPRFMITLHGAGWGELYYYQRGYRAEYGIPVPSSTARDGVTSLDIGERSLSEYKREIEIANHEWESEMISRSASMNRTEVASELIRIASMLVADEKKETFKCPKCGTGVLKNTGYCLKCKEKVEEK
jgi:predicted RNA-binding Zn-ribbon protein involved in translation (DUF1610 family)